MVLDVLAPDNGALPVCLAIFGTLNTVLPAEQELVWLLASLVRYRDPLLRIIRGTCMQPFLRDCFLAVCIAARPQPSSLIAGGVMRNETTPAVSTPCASPILFSIVPIAEPRFVAHCRWFVTGIGNVRQTYAGGGANGCWVTLVPLFILVIPAGEH